MEEVIRGGCAVCPDSFTVYQIIPERRWTMDRLDPEKMSDWIFEDFDPEALNVAGYFKQKGYRILIAGKDFGCGSKSVEHPMAALQGAGVKLVIAESFSRYSFRNALNLGLPVITCPGILRFAETGDILEADIFRGELKNITRNTVTQITPLSGFARELIEDGGTINHIMKSRNPGK